MQDVLMEREGEERGNVGLKGRLGGLGGKGIKYYIV